MMQGAIETARFILEAGLEVYPEKKKLWLAWCKLEEDFGSKESLAQILKDAKDKSGKIIFVLKYCKHVWKKLDDSK